MLLSFASFQNLRPMTSSQSLQNFPAKKFENRKQFSNGRYSFEGKANFIIVVVVSLHRFVSVEQTMFYLATA